MTITLKINHEQHRNWCLIKITLLLMFVCFLATACVSRGYSNFSTSLLHDSFSDKTVTGYHNKKGFTFTRYYHPDGRVFGRNKVKGDREGRWKIIDNQFCEQWGRKLKCRDIKENRGIFYKYDRKDRLAVTYAQFQKGNQLQGHAKFIDYDKRIAKQKQKVNISEANPTRNTKPPSQRVRPVITKTKSSKRSNNGSVKSTLNDATYFLGDSEHYNGHIVNKDGVKGIAQTIFRFRSGRYVAGSSAFAKSAIGRPAAKTIAVLEEIQGSHKFTLLNLDNNLLKDTPYVNQILQIDFDGRNLHAILGTGSRYLIKPGAKSIHLGSFSVTNKDKKKWCMVTIREYPKQHNVSNNQCKLTKIKSYKPSKPKPAGMGFIVVD